MSWHQLSVTTNEHIAPELADYFSEIGAVSVTYMDAEDQPVYEPLPGETIIWPNTRVIALFELEFDPDQIKTSVNEQFNSGLSQWTYERLEDQAWERSWMAYYQPMKFADRLWVCPTGQEQHEPGTVCLTLDPGLAFGTGTHPTTALCLEWLASHDLTDKVVIDYGCGSGILAVAAVLLGAREAHAIDIDPQALTATEENARKNHIPDRITCYLPDNFVPFQADVVLANILAKPLIDLSTAISGLVAPSGCLVLSGILNEQAPSVAEAYTPLIDLGQPVQQDDWCRLDGIKKA
ncbi:50S ribosomal protein L11 methyltransferase [Methylicorpusculum sp.]|uniref:50S ribosomal protein L11 methyltransferase n=1 Tax=Methylicorpusculum sp. TaxID=2713644 RepID=UPI002735EDE8|nr:50S ribosomal protein L11 methyltransferase [Methylicorpusculum sp.]MDP3528157.1 50S ribosomal protein L11 methyltransferase [Methylicorpusculum sp.]MDZ4152562.1 50S ribosomal protein L11 methyltransferase [Methylicorpusculum sp.]